MREASGLLTEVAPESLAPGALGFLVRQDTPGSLVADRVVAPGFRVAVRVVRGFPVVALARSESQAAAVTRDEPANAFPTVTSVRDAMPVPREVAAALRNV